MSTGWSECLVLANRSQREVSAAIERLRERLPFPLLGIDSDNDSAFINDNLFRYCQQEKITFTRPRPYKKNDQCHFSLTCFVFSLSQTTVVRSSARRMGKKIVIRHELGEKSGLAWNWASVLITGYIHNWADKEIVISMEPPCNLAGAQYRKLAPQ